MVIEKQTFQDELIRKAEQGSLIKENKWVIPRQLCEDDFRFIKIQKKAKIPLEKSWQKDNNYNCVSPVLEQWIKEGNNYGVVGGFGKLLIVDFDDKTFESKYVPLLPPTFTVQTGGGGKHLYYFIDDAESFKILDKNKNTLADIQGRGKQVIGPGSLHPSGNHYKVLEDVPIATITLKALKIVFAAHLTKTKDMWAEVWENDTSVQKIKDKLNLMDVLNEYNYDTSKNPTTCGLGHGSKGGKCFSFTESTNLFNCFHCGIGGDMFTLVMQHENCDFNKAKQILMEKAGINVPKIEIPVQKASVEALRSNVLMLMASKKNAEAVELMTQNIESEFYINTIRDDEKPEMWIYNEGIYIPHGKTFIQEFCREVLGGAYNTHFVNKIIDKVRVDTYIDQNDFFINEDVELTPCQNGILNLKTKKLQKFNPKFKFFNKLPMEYRPEAKCPAIEAFFKSTLTSQGDIDVIQEIFGFLLYRDYFIEKAIMFHGDGRNGKGKTIELMKRFIGADNCANITLQSLDKDNFAMGELFNKMANLAADLPSTALTETGNFKSLTGHDLISAARKFLTRVHFVNYAKMIFSANELPDTPDATPAFFLRWVVIDFPYTFLSQKELNLREVNDKYRLADKNLIGKLSTNEELVGLLNWAIVGLDRLRANSDFSYAKGAEEVKKQWLRKASSLTSFIEDCIKVQYGGVLTKKDIKTAYWLYCEENGLIQESKRKMEETINKTLPVVAKRITSLDHSWGWEGIVFEPSSGIAEKMRQLNTLEGY
jgi:P4 family phage/plasmid primase-like protien